MQETFIELVPRTAEALQKEMKELEERDFSFEGYNLPELRRSKTTFLNPEELMILRRDGNIAEGKQLALHLRTQERDVQGNIERIRALALHGVDIALLVTGDAMKPGQAEPATCVHHVLAGITEKPALDIAIGADLYMPDWGRWKQKKDAGNGIVSSVFTQPVFHEDALTAIDEHASHIPKDKVYVGITWISHTASREYWRITNHVPEGHLPGGDSDETIRHNSLSQSADMLRQARQRGYSAYIMPIRGTLQELETVLSLAEKRQD